MGAGVFLKRGPSTSNASEPEAVQAVKSAQRVERKAVVVQCFPFFFFSNRNLTASDNSRTLALAVMISTI